jgi:hypothetical protein
MLLTLSLGVKCPEREADLLLPSSARRLRIRGSGPLLPYTLSGSHSYKYNFLLTQQQNHCICSETTKTVIQWVPDITRGHNFRTLAQRVRKLSYGRPWW